MICPKCKRENDDNWPVTTPDGFFAQGGCQECWENESDDDWWDAFDFIMEERYGHRKAV